MSWYVVTAIVSGFLSVIVTYFACKRPSEPGHGLTLPRERSLRKRRMEASQNGQLTDKEADKIKTEIRKQHEKRNNETDRGIRHDGLMDPYRDRQK